MNTDSDSPIDDDAEGHRFVPPEERPSVGDTPKAQNGDDTDDTDDTEGHKLYRSHVGVVFG